MLNKYQNPEIFNTDQGSQFTSNDWIKTLTNSNIKISMDGKGRCFDNIFSERLWRNKVPKNKITHGITPVSNSNE